MTCLAALSTEVLLFQLQSLDMSARGVINETDTLLEHSIFQGEVIAKLVVV